MGCAHDGCMCRASEGQEFCSDYCREHAGETEHVAHACECGHDACVAAAPGSLASSSTSASGESGRSYSP